MRYQVRTLKVSKENLSKKKNYVLNMIFKESKWFYNFVLSLKKLFPKTRGLKNNVKKSIFRKRMKIHNAIRRKTSVKVFNKKENKYEERKFEVLGRRFREGIWCASMVISS